MVEIKGEDSEWAVIDRMGKMLRRPHADFKTTNTYSNFLAIICWTVQRIRTSAIHPNTVLADRLIPLNDPNFATFDAIQMALQNATIEEFFGRLPNASGELNTLRLEDDDGRKISALAFIIALRNAAAHGDGRNVKPVNRPGQLVGFEFSLSNPNNNFPQWSCQTKLNRSAMAQISGKLVDVFCDGFRSQQRFSESHLLGTIESE